MGNLYWRCVFGLAVVGFFSTVGPMIALGIINPWSIIPIALGGSAKALGYMIGWIAIPDISDEQTGNFDEPTEVGEFLAGVFAYLGFGFGLLIAVM